MTEHIDLKNIFKTFLRYALPSVVAMWIFSLYVMVDGIFVGRGVGPLALAAVNIATPFVNLIFAVSLLIAIGSSTMIAISLGKKEKERANELFSMCIGLLAIISVFVIIFTFFNLEKISLFLGATPQTIDMVKQYLMIVTMFNGFFMVSYALEVLVKIDGYPIFAIIGVAVAALTNVVLDYIFVMKMGMGVKGAAIATGISQFIPCFVFLGHFIFGKSTLKFRKFKFNFRTIKKMATLGIPDCITEFSTGIVLFLFNQIILMKIGEQGITAFSIIGYLNNFVIMTMIGITQGMQPIISYCHGREDMTNKLKVLKLGINSALIVGTIFLSVSLLFSRNIATMFIGSENVELLNFASNALKIFSISFVIVGLNICVSGFFTALEKTKIATFISLSRGLVCISLFLFILSSIFGELGIWMSVIVCEATTLLFSIVFLRNELKQQNQSVIAQNSVS